MSDDDDALTLSAAAARAGVHRSTLRRALDRGDFEGAAYRDDGSDGPGSGPWLIPVDVLDEHYPPDTPATGAPPSHEQSHATPSDQGEQEREQVDPDTPSPLVPIAALGPLFDQLAASQRRGDEAVARAAKAEAEAAFLRDRLAEARERTGAAPVAPPSGEQAAPPVQAVAEQSRPARWWRRR